jgi:Flp pilus assembly protein TadG
MAPKSSRRQRGRRGAEVLEAALIIVPLFGILFLLLDLSMVIFIRSTFQHAVREGVRYAITGANDTGPCQDDSIKAVVKKSALGFLNSPTASGQIHVHFQNPVTGAVSDNQYGNIVQVSVEGYQFMALAPYQRLNQNPMIWARAFDMMEAVPGSLPCITKSE